MWSAWQADRGMNFNSYLFRREGGCVVVDPLPLDDAAFGVLSDLGGVQTIVLTNRDHERAAADFRVRFGARIVAHSPEAASFQCGVDATFADRDEVFPGAFAVAVPYGKTAGEAAIHIREADAAIVGDALIGAPAGALALLPDEKLSDPRALLLSLRRLWALQLKVLLLGDGQPLFSGADAAIGDLIEHRLGAYANRINADELEFRAARGHDRYHCDDGEVGLLLGSRKLGYRVAKIPSGHAFCPLHWHVTAEEFFYVIEGRPSIRTLRGTIECRPGDFIGFPVGERGAHQLRNDSSEPCLVMLVGMEEDAVNFEACFYPDSDKVGLFTPGKQLCMVRSSPDLDYYDRE